MQQKIVTDWFFIRYADPKFHIRLRFKGDREQIVEQVIPALHHWTRQLIDERFIQEITLSPYEREIERYGGKALIDFAETVFHVDSSSVVHLLSVIKSKKISLADEVIAALSLIDYLKGLGLDSKQQLAFFVSQQMEKKELAGFRNCKTSLVSFCESIFSDTLENHSKEGSILNGVFQMRKNTLHAFASKMQEAEEKNELVNSSNMIQNSLLHMHCNRLLGLDLKKETKARLYSYQTLKVMEEKAHRCIPAKSH